MAWQEIRGHRDQVEMFRRAYQRGRFSQAYLFVGPEGIGKRMFARQLAQCLLCERFDENVFAACDSCPSCRQMHAGTHSDFLLVGCPPGKSVLPIELIAGSEDRRGREGLCYELSLRPMSGPRRIAVVDDAQLMNTESANALLKTLEEPPPSSALILLATAVDSVLPTIRSRCQLVRFAALSDRDVAELLVEQGSLSERTEAERIAAWSDGSLQTAAQLLKPGLRELRERLYRGIASAPFNSLTLSTEIIDALEELEGDRQAHKTAAGWMIRFVVTFLRQGIRGISQGTFAAGHEQMECFCESLGGSTTDQLEVLMQLLDRSADAERQLAANVPYAICLEGLFDEFGRLTREAATR
jgi:DNA polymerase-3 subunit delta'